MRVAPISDFSAVNIVTAHQPQTVSPVSNRKRNLFMVISFITFVINAVIYVFVIPDKNVNLRKHLYLHITPDSLFFKLWPAILCLIILVLIHNTWKDVWRKKASFIFIASNFVTITYTFVFQSRTLASIVVSGFVLASLDNLLIYFWRVLKDENIQAET